ncbi:family 78 glycoside hydrolase catalytic domain [Streptomyces sp. NBC_01176]|uniref:family 78 glycoside hydrolase catalytic domain n=1 Tax=Streptomyces sp. NBC_01176 TaxID=2903760 RepID=UPI00386655FD|nr:glycoside hydrolase family 78 protein [Streptomyces sp. NBC_01176]
MRKRRLAVGLMLAFVAAASGLGSTPGAAAVSDPDLQRGLAAGASALVVSGLEVEHQVQPLGVDVPRPRLSWQVTSGLGTAGRTAVGQVAYEVEVSTSHGGRGEVWDSGRVRSSRSFDVTYGGPALRSRTRYYWRVRSWDRAGKASPWSGEARFETAFVDPGDFHGAWIGAHAKAPALRLDDAHWIWYPEGNPSDSAPAGTRCLRRSFDLPAGARLSTAETQLTADDRFTLFVNGAEVTSSARVADSWRTASVIDIAPYLHTGTNVLAVEATNTGQGPAGVLGSLRFEGAGAPPDLVTDRSWKTSNSPDDGWEQPGYDDAAWPNALETAPYGSGPWGRSVSAPPPPETLLRDEFTAGKPIASARAHVAGLGYNKLYLNGRRIGDRELEPGFTVYDKTVLYSTYDVTDALRTGGNAIGVSLGRGFYAMTDPDEWKASSWWGEPKLKLELDITYTDGTHRQVVSDSGWKVSDGPTTTQSLWFGETYDARAEQSGWNRPGFDDGTWRPALGVDGPKGTLRSESFPPVKVTDHLKAEHTTPAEGTHVYDYGSPTAGWASIGVQGPAGATVTVTYGEKLRADGTVDNTGAFGMGLQTYSYTLKGDGVERYRPSYSYAGFRYAQVVVPQGVTLRSVDGARVHTAVASTGDFTSSSDLLNRYQDAQADTILNNLHSIPTDTPMYEKRPYTADGFLYADSAIANFDMRNFYESWMRSHRDDQNDDGSIGPTVPTTESGKQVKDPVWSASFVLGTWDLYWYYGDTRAVAENYDGMKAWLAYYEHDIAGTGGIYTGFSYGDWLSPEGANAPEGTRLSGTAYIYLTATRLATMARALGHDADARHFDAFATKVKDTFNATFYSRDKEAYYDDQAAGYRQTSNLLPLSFGLVPKEHRQAVIDNLVADIRARADHLDTGALGTKVLLPVLTDAGHADLAYTVATNPTYPGWGYWFEGLGATTMWEEWNANSRSHDHAFLGTVDDWLYQDVAGIEAAAPGYTRVTIQPRAVGDLTHASAHVESPLGRITSSWTRTPGHFTLRVDVPVGSTADVLVPVGGRQKVHAPAGATAGERGDGYARFTVGAGSHRFGVTDEVPSRAGAPGGGVHARAQRPAARS